MFKFESLTHRSTMYFWWLCSDLSHIGMDPQCMFRGHDLSYLTWIFCWLWSLIIFLMQRSLLSAVFIPHEVFTPQKYVHSSTRGSAEGGYPLCGVQGGYPPGWGVWGQAGPQRGFGGSVPRWGFRGEAPKAKIAL
jgi:hypothetical protein